MGPRTALRGHSDCCEDGKSQNLFAFALRSQAKWRKQLTRPPLSGMPHWLYPWGRLEPEPLGTLDVDCVIGLFLGCDEVGSLPSSSVTRPS